MRPFIVTTIALMTLVSPVVAQDDAEYPHGEWEDDCTMCHQAETWRPATPGPDFDHGKSGFPLLSAHSQTRCESCHRTLRFAEAEPDCVSCHLDVHEGELGIDCARCHSTRSFIDRVVMQRLHVTTRLPLRGTHLSVDCGDCHPPAQQGKQQYVGTPTECDACHLEEYLATTSPNHLDAGFSQDCATCHPPTLWEQARFNHNLVSAACVTCHMDDYLGTDDPDHENAGFPTNCEACHNTRDWDDADFDHDGPFFPIESGPHAGRWDDCSDCHTNPTNYGEFSCLGCHPHSDRGKTDDDHDEVNGYVYDSQNCLACHPDGRE